MKKTPAETVQGMTTEQMASEIARLTAENQKLAKVASHGIKISEKGAISVYGLGRFPVTLYLSQWEALIERSPEISDFLKANKDNPKLAKKPDHLADRAAEVQAKAS